ncbi:hypothetical protein Ahy_B06g083884 isoform C [Arachis hypogaea]|uniref:Uncharacterized protein n=1 Tax=Arachis hypogaea TaxID=3818 RepID=A0A444YQK3_ARAHY|nr:hypothetical protein Ahy_B06g083884 isoform C [Arachis hypogaea]
MDCTAMKNQKTREERKKEGTAEMSTVPLASSLADRHVLLLSWSSSIVLITLSSSSSSRVAFSYAHGDDVQFLSEIKHIHSRLSTSLTVTARSPPCLRAASRCSHLLRPPARLRLRCPGRLGSAVARLLCLRLVPPLSLLVWPPLLAGGLPLQWWNGPNLSLTADFSSTSVLEPLICRAPALPAPVPHAPSRVSIVLPLPCLCALCSGSYVYQTELEKTEQY